jgi:SnoaL-like domain
MRKKVVAALAGLALAAGIAVPAASATASDGSRHGCAAQMDAAVHEDNDAYNARDEARYQAVLNPKMIYAYDGTVIYGRDAIMEGARTAFATPGWVWTYTILSETLYGCHSGIAVLDAHTIKPGQNYDHHFAITMTMVREDGRWTVAMDTIHLLPS